jgi:hypothetical protein
MANVPLSGETGWILPVIWENDQSRDLRRINTTGKSVEIEKFVSTEQQLLSVRHRKDDDPCLTRRIHPLHFAADTYRSGSRQIQSTPKSIPRASRQTDANNPMQLSRRIVLNE